MAPAYNDVRTEDQTQWQVLQLPDKISDQYVISVEHMLPY